MQKVWWICLCFCLTATWGCRSTQPSDQVKVVYPDRVVYPQEVKETAEGPAYEEEKAAELAKVEAPKKVEEKKVEPAAAPVREMTPTVETPKVPEVQVAQEPVPPPVQVVQKTQPAEAKAPVSPAPATKGKFALRIISLPHHDFYYKQACEIAKFIKEKQGVADVEAHTAKNKKSGDTLWVVDVGSFEDSQTEEARAFLSRIRELRYQGRRQFEDAYYIPR